MNESNDAGTEADGWKGRREKRTERLGIEPALRLAGVLDRSDPMLEENDQLPPMWHWVYFLLPTRQSELGPDGHPRRGGFLPPIPLPRRMFAGGRTTFHCPLSIGAEASCDLTVVDVRSKHGRSGPLIFVTTRIEYRSGKDLAAVEEQDIVFTEGGIGRPVGSASEPIPDLPWRASFQVDPILLFRFSAVTFNAHRIHFDAPYATEVEGYPGLVLQGPLLALKLLELLHENEGRSPVTFSFRAKAPVFEGEEVLLIGGPDADPERATLLAYTTTGSLAMESSVSFSSREKE